ncbi:ABC transporter substrate-binding protein [Aphanothece hegewaldii CCALA 016]|uniref:ABC transporter substrate-binding protein n=1 Tax=Aphanothece hegewaldii CCALA 016 TaxID=2107694 RepID=A0A2T1M2L4_9CHRO|nr:substrate-binding domain-containing protein [Aphanothece hegewaldii]PSF38917.1 ABC transporter substrate-binding protein [Aphanothece hegewaldii CCALA 016]
MSNKKTKKIIISTLIAATSLGLAYLPIPGINQTLYVVSGSELTEPLNQIETRFEQENPNIKLELKFQGSQDIVNKYIDDKNDFKPTILIPASAEFLDEIKQRWQNQNDPFYEKPESIAKTFLVGIAWPERGKILFPDGQFAWNKLEKAMIAGNWQKIGGQNNWGSFDFLITDPTRSNSGQTTLFLWVQSLGKPLNDPQIQELFRTIKNSVYLPPRSTDILLQEFITRGSNDVDVATVYESIALYRWQQSQINQGKPYQIYYLSPTIETVATAAIVRRDVGGKEAKAAQKFIEFLREPEQQKIFIKYGFRPVINGIDLQTVPNSPWTQNIPGSELNPPVNTVQVPNSQTIGEIQRLWNRAN